MGGQTIRQLEEYLRNGDPEEIAYQKSMEVKYLQSSKAVTMV